MTRASQTWQGRAWDELEPIDPDIGYVCEPEGDAPGDDGAVCLAVGREVPRAQGDAWTTSVAPDTAEQLGAQVTDPVDLVNGELVVRRRGLALPAFARRHSAPPRWTPILRQHYTEIRIPVPAAIVDLIRPGSDTYPPGSGGRKD